MKVLFVSSGNSGAIKVLVKNQAIALKTQGIDVNHFLITGKGLCGYIMNIPKLRRVIKSGGYDVVHAHYSLSAFVATIAGCKSLVVSLMGSDVFTFLPVRCLIRLCYLYFWKTTIVKTEEMKIFLKLPQAVVLPNGVDIELFRPIDKQVARRYLNMQKEKKIILFLSDPERIEKNFRLATKAVNKLGCSYVRLLPVFKLSQEIIPYYLNAGDVLLLTSSYEGGVNVVKEAMACNVPIVSTDVGDVKENLANVNGSYVCNSNTIDIADGISEALKYKGHLNGREKLIEMGLDSVTISKRIIAIYEKVIDEK